MSEPASSPARRGVIHDIGYQPFTGKRQSTGAVAWSLYILSLRHCFGLGRSGKSKVMPWLVAALLMVPALVLAGLLLQLNKMSLSSQADLFAPLANYFGFPYWTQLLITIFAAAQAPVLFARDLRYRTVVLYFARPLSRTAYILMRLAALTTALFAVVAVPLTVWYAAAMSADVDHGEHTRNYLAAIVGVAILALLLATFSGMVSAITTRSGLAVTAVIVALMLTSGIVTAVQGTAYDSDNRTLSFIGALFNPFTVVAEFVSGAFHQPTPSDSMPHPAGGWTLGFGIAALCWLLGSAYVLLHRTRKAASI
ncbi:ABC transporter permease [Flexivirga oryzae]|uniref:ABC-2 type transport system permease protein n=1 Tax=Flexivirga oryzae TaxID=1794944 RepID=A0A839NEA0_9MICO|nr:ABC transporter permease [Flexivirga oryzae]MBB2894284.1 ABC-2 type transport system permease protein [Flexivirga oryzae]